MADYSGINLDAMNAVEITELVEAPKPVGVTVVTSAGVLRFANGVAWSDPAETGKAPRLHVLDASDKKLATFTMWSSVYLTAELG